MPGRLGVTGRGFRGQGNLVVGADRRHVRHDRVDPLGREAMAMVSRMPRLSAWLTSGRCLETGLGAPGGSTEGGAEEFDELRFSRERSSWISACKSAICLWASSNCTRASSKAAWSWPHSGQEATGLAAGSFMYDQHTEMARNCNVFNDYQALSRKIGTRRGTERLLNLFRSQGPQLGFLERHLESKAMLDPRRDRRELGGRQARMDNRPALCRGLDPLQGSRGFYRKCRNVR